jgi:hypothetical protein
MVEVPVAFTIHARGETWIQDNHSNSAANTTAHELGHAAGRRGHNQRNDPTLLMQEFDVGGDPCRIDKVDWDLVNP